VAEPRWLEVSLVLSGELAEAVSEVLGRFVEGGVAVETNVEYNDAEDEGTPFGPVRIYGYLSIDNDLEDKTRKLEEALWYLGRIQELPKPVYTPIEDQDWMNSWKQHYKPIQIGKKIMIVPAWIEMDTKERVPLRIDPSMAFGTGTHPTTQLCLEMVEKYVQPGSTVIDVGCGSGILSIGAIKLGAKSALGVDIDLLSIKASMENAELNQVVDQIHVFQGSVTEVKSGQFGMNQSPLVLANILAPVIIRLFAAGLADLVEPGGTLVLSGILEGQAEEVRKAAEDTGVLFIEKLQSADWVALAFSKPNLL
jgi:ribosomal protein L11 methyltransferase